MRITELSSEDWNCRLEGIFNRLSRWMNSETWFISSRLSVFLLGCGSYTFAKNAINPFAIHTHRQRCYICNEKGNEIDVWLSHYTPDEKTPKS